MRLYCGSAQGGIFQAKVDLETGRTSRSKQASAHPGSCFFLAAHPRLSVFYSADLSRGAIESYRGDRAGRLRRTGIQNFPGTAPCHLLVEPLGGSLLVAEYRGGLRSIPLGRDGGLAGAGQAVAFAGNGPVRPRQDGSHPHGIAYDGRRRRAYVADLGADRIFALELARARGAPKFVVLAEVAMKPGAGPRHVVLSPDGRLALVVNELNNTLCSFRVAGRSGAWLAADEAALLPPEFKGESWAAEAAFHPSGSACYASNRGHDSLAWFPLDPRTGRLGRPRWLESGGGRPGSLAVTARGTRIFAANERADCVASFALDPRTGAPRGRIRRCGFPAPTCACLRP